MAIKKIASIKKNSRRNIIRRPKTAWIFFCSDKRADVLNKNPNLKFGDVCKHLAPLWKNMSSDNKQKYEDLYEQDKKRYQNEIQNLTPDQLKVIRMHKKYRRTIKRQRPKNPLSSYMFFVMKYRPTLVAKHPNATFMEIGKLLGEHWNNLSKEDRAPYEKMHADDRIRYDEEMKGFNNKKQKKQ